MKLAESPFRAAARAPGTRRDDCRGPAWGLRAWQRLRCLGLVWLVGLLAMPMAHAARHALVIGIDQYDHITPLRNAAADAQAMAQALKDVGYDVFRVVQPRRDLRSLQDDIREFSQRIRGGDEVVLFFSGHGVQIDGDNYLLPSDVRAQGEAQVRDDALRLSRVLADLRSRQPAFTLAVVDACRDNPFETVGRNIGGRGLTGVAGATGQMVIYAAGEGQKALDRLGNADPVRNGVFTRVFVQEMKRPGVKLQDVMLSVRQRVYELAQTLNHTQVPAIYDQVLGTFYFVPAAQSGVAGAATLDVEGEAWALCRSGRTAGPCRRYLAQYPAGRYATLAQIRIDDIEQPPAQAGGGRLPQTTASLAMGQVIRDCAACPELVVVGSGSFVMGSPADEAGRDDDEGPQRQVSIGQPFALGRTEVTVREWKRFVADSNYKTDAERNAGGKQGCNAWDVSDGKWDSRAGRSWRSPGWVQQDNEPVVCVSWNDVQRYIAWLNDTSGQRYRLPTEAEWEYAARAGTATSRPWGDDAHQSCNHANGADQTKGPQGKSWNDRFECSDGFWFAAPVMSYRPNPWGLHDMLGNVWEWTQDCRGLYGDAPKDGSAREAADCSLRVLRGGGWLSSYPTGLRSAYRNWDTPVGRDDFSGFRLARTVF